MRGSQVLKEKCLRWLRPDRKQSHGAFSESLLTQRCRARCLGLEYRILGLGLMKKITIIYPNIVNKRISFCQINCHFREWGRRREAVAGWSEWMTFRECVDEGGETQDILFCWWSTGDNAADVLSNAGNSVRVRLQNEKERSQVFFEHPVFSLSLSAMVTFVQDVLQIWIDVGVNSFIREVESIKIISQCFFRRIL